MLRDELQVASRHERSNVTACGADLSVPRVVTTLAHTNCGDRIDQGEATIADCSRRQSLTTIGTPR